MPAIPSYNVSLPIDSAPSLFELATVAFLNNATVSFPLDASALQDSLSSTALDLSVNAQAVDLSHFTFMTVMNVITLCSTYVTCSAPVLQPIPAFSCLFNALAFASTLLLNVLIGIDSALQPWETSSADAPSKLFQLLGAETKSKLPLFGSKMQEHKSGKLEDLAHLLHYDYNAETATRCLSVDLSRLTLGLVSDAKHTVCLTAEGLKTLTAKHKFSSPVNKLTKTLRKHKVGIAERNAMLQLYGQYGQTGSQLMGAIDELHQKYSKLISVEGHAKNGVSADVKHKGELLFHVGLDLL